MKATEDDAPTEKNIPNEDQAKNKNGSINFSILYIKFFKTINFDFLWLIKMGSTNVNNTKKKTEKIK